MFFLFCLINPSETVNETKTRLLERISMMLGGRAAEEFIFNEATIGAYNDIENATRLAKSMVTSFGMTKEIGLVNLMPSSDPESSPFQKYMSENMAFEVDKKIKEIIDESYQQAYKLLKKKSKTLKLVTKVLIEEETLSDDRFIELVKEAGEDKEINWEGKYEHLKTRRERSKKDDK